MSDAPTPTVAATPPDPDRAALPRVACMLRLVRKLVAYGTTLLTALQQGGASHRRTVAVWRFGTKDLALIVARITCGLQRAAALEARLNRYVARGADLPLPSPRPSAARPRPRQAARADAAAPERAALLAALPSAEEIARQVRTRSLGVVITDICRDLGLTPGAVEAPLWDALMEAVMECGIDLVRFIRGDGEARFDDDAEEEDVAPARVTLPAPCVQAAIAASAQPP
jgi:hypothetical protein